MTKSQGNRLVQGDTLNGTIYVTGSETTIIANGTKYRVKPDPNGYYRSITYDGTTYEVNDIFTGTAETEYTGDGTFGEVINITNWEFYITIKKDESVDDADALTQHLTVLTAPTNGAADYVFEHEETIDLVVGNNLIEFKWKDADSYIFTFIEKQNFMVISSLLNDF